MNYIAPNTYIIFLTVLSFFTLSSQYPCNIDPYLQIYPNQNQCALLATIPSELRNLPYGIYPNTDLYNTDRFNYNKRFNFFPHAIFIPTTYDEVAFVLNSLRTNKLPFAVRAGGHCFGPGSLSSGYVIDVRNFNDIIPNVADQTVFIGAGAKLGPVIEALGAIDYAIPTGTCPSVGITGLTLEGGIGFLARQFGLTSDSLISLTVMLANGEIIEVSRTNHPDLFWALGGAGAGSYGIVLGLTFQMYYIPQASSLELSWDFTPELAHAIMNSWQHWITCLSTTMSTELHFLFVNGKPTIEINVLKIGAEELNEWKPIFESLNPRVLLLHGRYVDVSVPFASTYVSPFVKAKSKFLFKPLSTQGIQIITQFFEQLTLDKSPYAINFEIGASSGMLAQGDSAYFARDAFAYFFMFIRWNYQKEESGALSLIRNFYNNISPFTSIYSYANLVDFDLDINYLTAYYGDNVNRLISVKNMYDPENIFRWRQSIPTSFTSPLVQKSTAKFCQ